jgi:hypothetical protein
VSRFRQRRLTRRTGLPAGLAAAGAGVLASGYVVLAALAAPIAPASTATGPSAHPAAGRPPSGRYVSRVARRWPAQSGRHIPGRPPAPVIVAYPPNPTKSRSARFTFTDAGWPNVRFSCELDAPPATWCLRGGRFPRTLTRGRRHGVEGEQQYSDLTYGPHCFYVQAVSRARKAGPIAQYCWSILPPSAPFPHHRHPVAQNFRVGGNLPEPLYPGTSEPLDLTFTNPNSAPITIAAGAITASTITITSNQPGCGSSNFGATQGLTVAVTIPARQLVPLSLSALGVPEADWPVIEMVDTDTNQDACEGATLTLTYSGIEASG